MTNNSFSINRIDRIRWHDRGRPDLGQHGGQSGSKADAHLLSLRQRLFRHRGRLHAVVWAIFRLPPSVGNRVNREFMYLKVVEKEK